MKSLKHVCLAWSVGALLFVAAGCDRQAAPAPASTPPVEAPVATPDDANAPKLPAVAAVAAAAPTSPVGSYVGMFGKNKMTMIIEAYDPAAGTLSGRSVTAGNDRPFTGTAVRQADQLAASVKEPGDQPDDGAFELTLVNGEVRGTWTPGTQGTAKTFVMTRREFAYSADVGEYPQFSKEKVAQDDITDMSIGEVRIALNEIYARHGYNFKNKDMRRHFDAQAWYMPMHHDVRKDLSDIETKNIAMLTKYRKFIEKYGDDFGR